METETRDRIATMCEPDKYEQAIGRIAEVELRHDGSSTASTVTLTLAELQAIVQQAWDQHGVCADPFASETDWLDGAGDLPSLADMDELNDDAPRVVEHRDGHVVHRTVEFTHAAHNTGARS